MKLSEKHARCVLVVAIMTSGISLAAQGAERHLGPTPFDSNILEQAMALYGLNEDGAIKRLAAESEAVDIYSRVTSMALAGYAGAWFDADSQKLHVALKGDAGSEILSRLGVMTVPADWSLLELEHIQRWIDSGGAGLPRGEALRRTHVDYRLNRVVVGVVPERVEDARNLLEKYANQIVIQPTTQAIGLTADVRGADGTRNYTWFLEDSKVHPCSIGVSVENGFYTAGHCGFATHAITTPAGTPLGTVVASGYVTLPALTIDIGWVQTSAGWTRTPKINGYTDGLLYVAAKWSGTSPALVGSTTCRYGQTSGGPHCGVVNATGVSENYGWFVTYTNLVRVAGSCSDDGDSGGPWLLSGTTQVLGTNVGGAPTNTCPIDAEFTYFQPISDHISAYAGTAGSLLTSHGAASPTVSGFLCPNMGSSGMGTFFCTFNHYNSQGITTVNWSSPHLSWGAHDTAYGTCTKFDTVSVKLTVTNPYGSYSQTKSFACPMGPIP